MNKTLNKKMHELPDKPGVYIFRSRKGIPIYIGKATSLQKRVLSYLRKNTGTKTRAMINNATDIEFIELKNSSEALLLEGMLIKNYQPKYNIEWKDDKRFPLIKIDLTDKWPKIQITRIRKTDALYFGQFTDTRALKTLTRFIRKTFKIRSCKYKKLKPAYANKCLYYHMNECTAPCRKDISPNQYHKNVKEVILFLEGRVDELIKNLRYQMKKHSQRLEYEQAAKKRDIIQHIEKLFVQKARKSILKANIESYHKDTSKTELTELKKVLNLKNIPVYIEAFDISNLFGTNPTGSLVTFKNGLPYKKAYKKFNIKTVKQINDYAMLQETVKRHYSRRLQDKQQLPDLILIDGGKGQLSAVKKILKEINIQHIPIIGLAKKLEEIFIPSSQQPVHLKKNNPSLKLLMRIRDEAHRFAITHHKKLRSKSEKFSILDEIEGIGNKRKKTLLTKFGSIARIKKAGLEELTKYIPKKTAKKLQQKIKKM